MIVEVEDKAFVNEYGYSEKYISKELEMYRSGHVNRGSAYSSYDDCGNCDGVKCSNCHETYQVSIFDQPKYNDLYGYMEIPTRMSRIFMSLEDALIFYKKN